MQLVEIIMGKKTSDETLAKTMDYVKQIRKTPIVVNDSRGFYTSRCFGTYVGEGLAMLGEGVPPAMIENVGRMTGMPMAPLALNDEVSLDLAYKVREQTKRDLGDKYVGSPADDLVKKMVVDLGRVGKKAGKGFYDYPAPENKDGKKKLWPGLADLVGQSQNPDDLDVQELKNRFLYIQALEAARCFEEGVVTDVRDADVGAILGWGFAPWAGGPLSLSRHGGNGSVCRSLRQARPEIQAPLRAVEAPARHGLEGRNLLRPLRPVEGEGGSLIPPAAGKIGSLALKRAGLFVAPLGRKCVSFVISASRFRA